MVEKRHDERGARQAYTDFETKRPLSEAVGRIRTGEGESLMDSKMKAKGQMEEETGFL